MSIHQLMLKFCFKTTWWIKRFSAHIYSSLQCNLIHIRFKMLISPKTYRFIKNEIFNTATIRLITFLEVMHSHSLLQKGTLEFGRLFDGLPKKGGFSKTPLLSASVSCYAQIPTTEQRFDSLSEIGAAVNLDLISFAAAVLNDLLRRFFKH